MRTATVVSFHALAALAAVAPFAPSDSSSALQPSPRAIASATTIAPPSPAASASPNNATMRTHADPVADYTLRASLNPEAHTIHGEGAITWRNASATSVRELWVHLYLNAFKNERSVFLREPVGGFRGNRALTEWGSIDVRRFALKNADGTTTDLWPLAETHRPGDDDETDARIPLPREIVSNETVEFEVTWDDKLPPIVERTGYDGTFHFAGQWFPKIARLEDDGRWAHFPFHHLAEFYADFGSYDVTIDAPSNFTIGATGPLVSSHVDNGRLFERHVQNDIHDFAFTAWDRFKIYSEEIDGVAVRVLYPPGYDSDAERELRTIRFALPYYGAKYGAYPYSILTLVHPPRSASEAGGMEYPTLITTGGSWWEPKGIHEVELTAIHEFGHQYFYGLLASDEMTWPFLDEGLNSFAEEEALGAWFGDGSLASLGGISLSDTTLQAAFSNLVAKNEPVAQPAYAFETGREYGGLVYSRSATILETFRRVYGDQETTRALGLYARRYRFLHPTPENLFASYAEVLGEEPARTMRAAFYDRAWVDYAITAISSRRSREAAGIFDRNGKRETVSQGSGTTDRYEGWVLVTRRGTLRFPVTVELTLDDGSTRRLSWSGTDDAVRLPYEGTVGIRGAVVDPDHAILLDEDLSNNFAMNHAESSVPRTLERALYWAEIFLQGILP
jgi:hypothetical protein